MCTGQNDRAKNNALVCAIFGNVSIALERSKCRAKLLPHTADCSLATTVRLWQIAVFVSSSTKGQVARGWRKATATSWMLLWSILCLVDTFRQVHCRLKSDTFTACMWMKGPSMPCCAIFAYMLGGGCCWRDATQTLQTLCHVSLQLQRKDGLGNRLVEGHAELVI